MMENMSRFHIRPARPDEAGLFYTPHPEEDKRRGTIGHVRMDFGRSGNEFWHTWWPRGPEELNSPAFKAELQEVVDMMREDILKSRFAMERFCYEHGGKITGGYVQNYGYKCVREELPYRPTTGFRYEVLTDDSAVRKAVDDIVFDLYGEENPRQQEDYEPQSGPNMTLGGM